MVIWDPGASPGRRGGPGAEIGGTGMGSAQKPGEHPSSPPGLQPWALRASASASPPSAPLRLLTAAAAAGRRRRPAHPSPEPRAPALRNGLLGREAQAARRPAAAAASWDRCRDPRMSPMSPFRSAPRSVSQTSSLPPHPRSPSLSHSLPPPLPRPVPSLHGCLGEGTLLLGAQLPPPPT